jgi:uncharacterized membrane protein
MAAFGSTSTPDAHGGRPVLVDAALRLEHAEALDPLVDRLSQVAAAVVRDRRVADLLHGRAIGHAAHPLLTDVPIGTWMSAFLLDLVGGKGSRPAARRLIGVGVVAAVPTVLTGYAEFAVTSDRPSRRVAVVHAGANAVGLLLYAASYRARGRGRHARGVLLSLAGLGVVGGSGFLGGHLAIARKVGTRDPAFVAQVPLPDEVDSGGTSLADAAGLTTGEAAADAGTGRHVDTGTDPTAQI